MVTPEFMRTVEYRDQVLANLEAITVSFEFHKDKGIDIKNKGGEK